MQRPRTLRDMVLAALLAVVIVVILTQTIDNRWPDFAFFDLQKPRETFPAFSMTSAATIQAAASPHLTAPMRKIGWSFTSASPVAWNSGSSIIFVESSPLENDGQPKPESCFRLGREHCGVAHDAVVDASILDVVVDAATTGCLCTQRSPFGT